MHVLSIGQVFLVMVHLKCTIIYLLLVRYTRYARISYLFVPNDPPSIFHFVIDR